ncbi:hypothetical protein UNSWDHB_646 [Dehalobacter sp. UNSWDHB]|nr:hypothetical protein UNSWDHB_646 [Dehalobacter sp. UNSWDHB]
MPEKNVKNNRLLFSDSKAALCKNAGSFFCLQQKNNGKENFKKNEYGKRRVIFMELKTLLAIVLCLVIIGGAAFLHIRRKRKIETGKKRR